MRSAAPVQIARAQVQASDLAWPSRRTQPPAPARLPGDGTANANCPGGRALGRKRVLVHPRCTE
jgi:hypothetical protein